MLQHVLQQYKKHLVTMLRMIPSSCLASAGAVGQGGEGKCDVACGAGAGWPGFTAAGHLHDVRLKPEETPHGPRACTTASLEEGRSSPAASHVPSR